jgi:NarL family two-component system response regulator LiaR
MEKIKILLAEDHAVVREGIRRVMEQEADFEVVAEAEDGEKAVKMAMEYLPDVALIDIIMPKLGGIEATKRIKESCPGVAVLALSAYDDDQFVFSLLEAGAAGYLLKSVHGRKLVAAIRAVHEGEAVLHPSIMCKFLRRPRHRSDKRPSVAANLSERELEVLRLATRGLSNGDIAKELALSLRTVQAHFTRACKKLQVSSRTEAVLHGLREGWLSLDDMLSAADKMEGLEGAAKTDR